MHPQIAPPQTRQKQYQWQAVHPPHHGIGLALATGRHQRPQRQHHQQRTETDKQTITGALGHQGIGLGHIPCSGH